MMAKPALLNLLFVAFTVISCSTGPATRSSTCGTTKYPQTDSLIDTKSYIISTSGTKIKITKKPTSRHNKIRVARSSTRGNTKYSPSNLSKASGSQGYSLVEPKKTAQGFKTRTTAKAKQVTKGTANSDPETLAVQPVLATVAKSTLSLEDSTNSPLPSDPVLAAQVVFPGMTHRPNLDAINPLHGTLRSSSGALTSTSQVGTPVATHRPNLSASEPLLTALRFPSNVPIPISKVVVPGSLYNPHLATSGNSANNSAPALPRPRYIIRNTTSFEKMIMDNGRLIFTGRYLVVIHSVGDNLAILTISTAFLNAKNVIDAVYNLGLIQARKNYPSLDLSGILIQGGTFCRVQHSPGPLSFVVDQTALATEFDWTTMEFDQIVASGFSENVCINIQKTQEPMEQPILLSEPLEGTISLLEPLPESKEQSSLGFAGNFQNAFHSYKVSTKFEASNHLYGTIFSGDGYRILLASVGNDIAALVMEEEGTDAKATLDRVLKDGLKAATSEIMGLSGLLIREAVPQAMEFMEGPLKLIINGERLTEKSAEQFHNFQVRRLTDSKGKFNLILKRSYRYFRGPHVLEEK